MGSMLSGQLGQHLQTRGAVNSEQQQQQQGSGPVIQIEGRVKFRSMDAM